MTQFEDTLLKKKTKSINMDLFELRGNSHRDSKDDAVNEQLFNQLQKKVLEEAE